MSKEKDTIQVFIPIAFKRKNGRPKILAPDVDPHFQARVQSPHILRALGRAWSWRRKLETGEAATIQDIARAEKVSTQFVGPIMRLAYLSPDVLERLLLWREAPSATLLQMVEATYLPWAEQMERVFDGKRSTARDLEPYATTRAEALTTGHAYCPERRTGQSVAGEQSDWP